MIIPLSESNLIIFLDSPRMSSTSLGSFPVVRERVKACFEGVTDASFITMDEAQDTAIEDGVIDPDFLLEDGKSYDDYKKVTLRFLNKITGESETFDLETGKTVAYGSLRIRPMSCKKSPPIEEPESTSFLQIWEKVHNAEDQWVFSGWMFASSPSLSAMEHPVYDVWVTDCKD